MVQVDVAEAQARLSQLLDAALRGDGVVIARGNVPLVRLTVLEDRESRPTFGKLAGKIRMAPDFDEPLEDFAGYV